MKFINRNNFSFESYKLSPAEYLLKSKMRPKPIVLDLRSLEDSKSGTIENAYRMPHNEFADCLIQLPPFGDIIVYSDAKNNYLSDALKLLWDNGFNEIFYVDGGYNAIMESLFEFEPESLTKIKSYLAKQGKNAIKLDLEAYSIDFELVNEPPDENEYKAMELAGIHLYFPHKKLRLIEGTIIDFKDGKIQFDHPRWHKKQDPNSVKERVQKILDAEINPMVASHGGYVKLLNIEEDVAYVEMTGGCQGCGLSSVTLKQGVEAAIFQAVPEISQVLDTTDHAAGTNPYYVSPQESGH